MTMKRHICTKDGPFCDALMAEAAQAGKGLRIVQWVKGDSPVGRVVTTLGVAHCRTASRKDGGTLLSFCPWCGADVLPSRAGIDGGDGSRPSVFLDAGLHVEGYDKGVRVTSFDDADGLTRAEARAPVLDIGHDMADWLASALRVQAAASRAKRSRPVQP